MDIQIKRVYDPVSPDDGLRYLVDRFWPRGMAKDRLQANLWLKEVSPTAGLCRWFAHDPARWEEFKRRYFTELDANPTLVDRLLDEAVSGRLTLLYAARDTEHNQAAALREYLLARQG